MKLYGYKDEQQAPENVVPYELAEITLVATAAELRKIARFISDAAAHMDTMGKDYGHEHLSDKQPGFEGSPHFVVSKPDT
jgi:hypothetical protein